MSVVAKIAAAAHAKLDSWQNALTGLGGVRDKATYFAFGPGPRLSDETLASLYDNDDMASRIVDVLPDEMLRQGVTLQHEDQAVVSETHAKLDELKARESFNRALKWERLFGGCGVFVGADDGQDPREPLNEDAIRTLRFLNVIDRRNLEVASSYDEPTEPQFGLPRTFRVKANGGDIDTSLPNEAEIHESRLILFNGIPSASRLQTQHKGWGNSVLSRTYQPLREYQSHWLSVSHLLQDASQGVFKIQGLIDMIANGEVKTLQTRMELVDMSRSVARSLMLDAEREDFSRVATSFAGLPEVIEKSMHRLSAAARIPATILMAQSPAGLNATGESDIRWFYDTVAAAQTNELKPKLERLVYLIFRAQDGPTGGVEPEAWEVTFPPLWQPTAREKAELRKMISETDKVYIDAGVLLPEEVTISRFRPEGYSTEYTVDVEVSQKALEADLKRLEEGTPEPSPLPVPPQDDSDEEEEQAA